MRKEGIIVAGISKFDSTVWMEPETSTLFKTMRDYIANGITTEILGYYPEVKEEFQIVRLCRDVNQWEHPNERDD